MRISIQFQLSTEKYKLSKSCSFLGLLVVGQKVNPLFRSDISDSLSLVEEIFQIASVSIWFLTPFHGFSMLSFTFFFYDSALLVRKL